MPRAAPTSARSTFAISPEDNEQIERIRIHLGKAGFLVNRTEVVRLGLNALDATDDESLAQLVDELQRRSPGRPSAKRRNAK